MKFSVTACLLIILLNSCSTLSLQKCRYGRGWNLGWERSEKAEPPKELKAEKAEKKSGRKPENLIVQTTDTILEEAITALETPEISDVNGNIHNIKKPLSQSSANTTITPLYKNTIKEEKAIPKTPEAVNGLSKTLRIILAVAGILLLLGAFVYIVLCIIHASLPYLLTAVTMSAISYLLLYIGKRKIKSELITIKRKEMKAVRKTAKWTAFITALVALIWQLGLVFGFFR